MTSLYPDESYCTSDVGRLLFQPKNEWAVTGKVVGINEVKQIAGTHIEYQIEIRCIPRNSIELDERLFLLTSRYRELNRLHASLSKLHKQLYLRGNFPQFAAPRLLGSCDPTVVGERRRSIDELFAFILDSEVLRKARVLQDLIERATEQAPTGETAGPLSFHYEAGNILDVPNIFDGSGDPPQTLTPKPAPPPENKSREPTGGIHGSETAGEFLFPDVDISADRPVVEISSRRLRKPSLIERLLSKRSTTSQISHKSAMYSKEECDYIVRAAHLVSTAQRAEHEQEYELAFQCYKNAASALIQGMQRESDTSRRNTLRRKTAKYLVAAERLYRAHLAYDGATPSLNLESLVDSTMSDPDVLAFQCANNCLKNYRVIGVLPCLNAPKWVLKVEETSTGKVFVMKLLEKGLRTSKSRVFLPTNVPHMIQLHQFFETEMYIILVLDYVENGTLWSFLAQYFDAAEKRFLFGLTGGIKKRGLQYISRDVPRMRLDLNDCYRGRRLHFSVGVDFERVADMRDESLSTDVPNVSDVCTMGEDATGACSLAEGDFYVIGDKGVDDYSLHEESPAVVHLPTRENDTNFYDERACQTLIACMLNVRLYLQRQTMWPSDRPLPEPLVVHWLAQIISWLYVMHNEYGEAIGQKRRRHVCDNCVIAGNDRSQHFLAMCSVPSILKFSAILRILKDSGNTQKDEIRTEIRNLLTATMHSVQILCVDNSNDNGDLHPDNLLIDSDGNLQITYHGKWHNNSRPKAIVDGYSAPECFVYGWTPDPLNDLWSLGAIMFELLSGRALINAAPHGVKACEELPFPEDVEISLAARDLMTRLLTEISARPSLEAVRAHALFRSINWLLYDNPHSVPLCEKFQLDDKKAKSHVSPPLVVLRSPKRSKHKKMIQPHSADLTVECSKGDENMKYDVLKGVTNCS